MAIRFEVADTGRLIVDDTGIGMSEAQLSRLFEPFNRLGAERTGASGSGLGLVIANKLVHAMGGTLEVQSLVGRGSRFQVSLPLAAGGGATPAFDPASAPAAFPSEWDAGSPQTVLYVEDDEVNTLLMEQVFLSQPAWRLVTAATGALGLRAAIEHAPAVILLDLHPAGHVGLRRARPAQRRPAHAAHPMHRGEAPTRCRSRSTPRCRAASMPTGPSRSIWSASSPI